MSQRRAAPNNTRLAFQFSLSADNSLPVIAPAYTPQFRRPIASAFRRTAHLAVRLCLRWRIHPDSISYSSILVSLTAGACFWKSSHRPILLIIAPLLCYVRLWLNMLDGMVALAAHQASRRGEILNDLPDRASDILIFAGVAHSGLTHPIVVYWAIIFALLTAYVGTLGQAVGAKREFGGIMSKPWRMVALHVGAWLTFASIRWSGADVSLAHLTILDWTCLIVIAGCIQTIWVRLSHIMRTLDRSGR